MMRPSRRAPCRPGGYAKALGSAALGLILGSGLARADPPLIDHQEVSCSLQGKHPRICATIADDGVIKRAKIFFRAAGQSTFYWSEMELDFRNFCATLPIPDTSIQEVQYYLWAIDDDLELERTPDLSIIVDPDTSCDHPVIDEDPERTANLVVHATSKKQGKKLKDFDRTGVDYRRFNR